MRPIAALTDLATIASHALSPCPSEASSPAATRSPSPEPRASTTQHSAQPAHAGMPARHAPTSSHAAAGQESGRSIGGTTRQGLSKSMREPAVSRSGYGGKGAACVEAGSAVLAGEGPVQRQGSLFASESGTLMSVVTMPAAQKAALLELGLEELTAGSARLPEHESGGPVEAMRRDESMTSGAGLGKTGEGSGQQRLNVVHVDST